MLFSLPSAVAEELYPSLFSTCLLPVCSGIQRHGVVVAFPSLFICARLSQSDSLTSPPTSCRQPASQPASQSSGPPPRQTHIFDWAIVGRPPIGSGLGLSPSHRLFWSTHVVQLHRISLYLAIEGPPNLVPRPSLPVVPWQLCCLQSQSSPSPVQSQTRRSAAPASTVDNLHLNLHCAAPWESHHPPDCCHLCCPPPPTHSPTSRPASKQPCSAVVSPGHRCLSSPPAVPAWAIANHTLWAQHGTRICFPPRHSVNLVPTSVSHPPSV